MTTYTSHEIVNIKVLTDLRESDVNELNESRSTLSVVWHKNDSYHLTLVSEDGKRYLEADRISSFDGYRSDGSYWKIRYGKIGWGFDRTSNPFEKEYTPSWKMIRNKTIRVSSNGTEIPSSVGTKKEVIAIAKQIGIFKL